jgi:hypothetical protein
MINWCGVPHWRGEMSAPDKQAQESSRAKQRALKIVKIILSFARRNLAN